MFLFDSKDNYEYTPALLCPVKHALAPFKSANFLNFDFFLTIAAIEFESSLLLPIISTMDFKPCL